MVVAFDVQIRRGSFGWQDIGHIVAIGFGQFGQPAVDESASISEAIPVRADHVVSLACRGLRGMEAVETSCRLPALAGMPCSASTRTKCHLKCRCWWRQPHDPAGRIAAPAAP